MLLATSTFNYLPDDRPLTLRCSVVGEAGRRYCTLYTPQLYRAGCTLLFLTALSVNFPLLPCISLLPSVFLVSLGPGVLTWAKFSLFIYFILFSFILFTSPSIFWLLEISYYLSLMVGSSNFLSVLFLYNHSSEISGERLDNVWSPEVKN